jgi:hypothetical protein
LTLVLPEESPNTVRQHASRNRGHPGCKSRVTESVTENIPPSTTFRSKNRPHPWLGRKWCGVRVKRRGKSPPGVAQAEPYEKPHVVQDKAEGKGSLPAFPANAGRIPRVIVAPGSSSWALGEPSEINDRHLAKAGTEFGLCHKNEARAAHPTRASTIQMVPVRDGEQCSIG